MQTATNDTTLAATLNAYSGDNIWEDAIYSLDFDEAAIEQADPNGQSDVVILTDGTRADHVNGEWVNA